MKNNDEGHFFMEKQNNAALPDDVSGIGSINALFPHFRIYRAQNIDEKQNLDHSNLQHFITIQPILMKNRPYSPGNTALFCTIYAHP